MKTIILLLPMIISSTLSLTFINNNGKLLENNNKKYTHLCLSEIHRLKYLDKDKIHDFDINGRDYSMATNKDYCTMTIVRKHLPIEKTEYFDVLYNSISKYACEQSRYSNIICTTPSNCSRARVCLPPPEDHVTNSFSVLPIGIPDDISMQSKNLVLQDDNSGEICTINNTTLCYRLVAANTNIITFNKILVMLVVLLPNLKF